MHNAVIYPVVCMIVAVILHGPAILFSQEINNYILVGLFLAVVEGVYRLKDGILHVKPAEEMVFPAAVYGVPLGLALQPILAKHAGVIREIPIPVDGFYSKGFVEKLERERRYGNVYTVEDRGGAFFLQLEFPRWLPDIGLPTVNSCLTKCRNTTMILRLKTVNLLSKGNAQTRGSARYPPASGRFPRVYNNNSAKGESCRICSSLRE